MALQIALVVADFLFNTRRYVFAIDFYEEIFVILSLLTSSGEFPLYSVTKKEYETYARSMTEDLKMAKRAFQNEHSQGEEVASDQQRRQEPQEANDVQKREIALYKTLGSAFYSLGQYMTSVWYYERAAEMAKATGNKLEEQRMYTSLAVAHNAIGQFDKAYDLQEKALQLSQHIGNLKGELECYNSLGSLYNARGEYELAIDCYSKGLDCNDRMAAAMSHNNLGTVYLLSGDYLKSIEQLKKSLRIRNDIDDTKGVSITLNNLSCVYYALGQYKMAITCQERARVISGMIGAKKQVAACYNNLGILYQALGEHQLSLKNHEKGLKTRKEIGDKEGECRAHKEMSISYDALLQLRDSLIHHEEALKLERTIVNNLKKTKFLAPRGQWISHQERGLEIIEEVGVFDGERLILYKIGLSHFSRLDVLKASDHLTENIKTHECIRQSLSEEQRLSLDELSVPLYKTLALMLLSLEHYTDALLTLEQGRARALVDLVLRKYAIQEVASTTFENLSGLTTFFVAQHKNFLFMATIMENICFWFIDRPGNLRFKSYLVTEDVSHDRLLNYFRTACFDRGVTGGADESKKMTCEAPSSESPQRPFLVEDVADMLTFPCEEEDDVTTFHFLHKVIFRLLDELPDEEEVIFVPEGPMFQFPFVLLQDADGNYLAERVRVRIVPSITTLKILSDSPADHHSTKGALLVGDPGALNITKDGKFMFLSGLPFARREVEMIGKLLNTALLIGRQATKEAVLRNISNASLVHFAVHGNAGKGELALASEESTNKEGCILTVEEIAKVAMRAKLVVLSTCHGARGRILKAEGVVGITRAFLGCGARSVLAAMWAVTDDATLVLMTKFYEYLLNQKMSASRALHQAMREMRNSDDFNKARHWAPFVLYGDDVTIDLNELCA